MIWQCPKCSLVLNSNGKSLVCVQGHSYDRAKQGYTNLLLANQKSSLDPGDNETMMNARRQFLRAGFYTPLVNALFEQILSRIHANLRSPEPFTLLDLGCGEGYYLESLAKKCQTSPHPALAFYGLDISKAAIRKAASSAKLLLSSLGGVADISLDYAIASSAHVPVGKQSLDAVITVFAPVSASELIRILKPDGVFIRVVPGSRHLFQLRSKIYTNVHLHEKLPVESGFELMSEISVQYLLQLDSSQKIAHLLAMTPFNWSGREHDRETLLHESTLDVEADFLIQICKPVGSDSAQN